MRGLRTSEQTPNPYVAPGLVTSKLTLFTAATILANELQTTIDELRQKSRKAEIRSKRQICIYLLNWYGEWKQRELGLLFNKDHATVIHSCRVVENDMLTDKRLKEFCTRMKHTKLRKE